MMSKGVRMMLEALGISINPEEIEQFYQKMRHDIPAMAEFVGQKFQSIDERLSRIEAALLWQPAKPVEAKGDTTNGKYSGELSDRTG